MNTSTGGLHKAIKYPTSEWYYLSRSNKTEIKGWYWKK